MSSTTVSSSNLAPQASPALGCWQASCGPKELGMKHYTVIAVVCLLLGVASTVCPYFVEGKTAADEQGAAMLFGVLGAIMIAIGLVIILVDAFSKEQIIHLFDGGLLRQVGDKTFEYTWNEIQKVFIAEDFEHRNAAMKLNVKVQGTDRRKFYFTSHFEGNADAIINAIKGRVEDLEYRKFQPE